MSVDQLKRVSAAALHLEELADRITEIVDEVDAKGTVVEACTVFNELNAAYKALDEARKRIYHQNDRMNKLVVPGKLEAAGTDKVRIPELGRSFYITTKYSAIFLDKEAGFDWLRNNGNEDLISETVNASTLASFIKDMVLEEGIDPPEDIVRFSSYNTTGSSKYTPKEKA